MWKWSFPARNRLIAAFSDIVVLVQAAARSGSLHTADAAIARNIPVGAVPGPIDRGISAGSNQLLADGAVAVVSAEAMVGTLGLDPGERRTVPAELANSFEVVRRGAATAILAAGGQEADRLLADLSRLEMDGAVERRPGGEWSAIG